jgi:hypothetical protein
MTPAVFPQHWPNGNCLVIGKHQSAWVTRVAGGCLLADDAKVEKTQFPQPADLQPRPSRDALGPRHVISRLLAQFETFGASAGHYRVTRFGRVHRRRRSQIPRYVYQTSKARQVSLTGLV